MVRFQPRRQIKEQDTEKQKLNLCYYEDDIEETTYYFLTNVTQEYINKCNWMGYWSDVRRWIIEANHLVIDINFSRN